MFATSADAVPLCLDHPADEKTYCTEIPDDFDLINEFCQKSGANPNFDIWMKDDQASIGALTLYIPLQPPPGLSFCCSTVSLSPFTCMSVSPGSTLTCSLSGGCGVRSRPCVAGGSSGCSNNPDFGCNGNPPGTTQIGQGATFTSYTTGIRTFQQSQITLKVCETGQVLAAKIQPSTPGSDSCLSSVTAMTGVSSWGCYREAPSPENQQQIPVAANTLTEPELKNTLSESGGAQTGTSTTAVPPNNTIIMAVEPFPLGGGPGQSPSPTPGPGGTSGTVKIDPECPGGDCSGSLPDFGGFGDQSFTESDAPVDRSISDSITDAISSIPSLNYQLQLDGAVCSVPMQVGFLSGAVSTGNFDLCPFDELFQIIGAIILGVANLYAIFLVFAKGG